MKLSRAIAVVLLLHVVAVGGVLAFGLIKPPPKPGAAEATKSAAAPVIVENPAARAPAVLASKPASRSPMTVGPRAAAVQDSGAAPAAPRAVSSAQDDALRLIEGAGPASAASGGKSGRPEESSGRSYVVARGDTPFSIAKKHGVAETALLRANSIDDPRKLQVGQRLVIPTR